MGDPPHATRMYGRYGGGRQQGGSRGGSAGGGGGSHQTPWSLHSPEENLIYQRKTSMPHLDVQGNIVVPSQMPAPKGKRGGRGKRRGRGGGRESAGVDGSNEGNLPYATDKQSKWNENDGMSQGLYDSTTCLISDEVSSTDAEAAKALIKRKRRQRQRQRQRERKLQEQILNSQYTVDAENYTNSEDSEQESVDEDDEEESDGYDEVASMDGSGQKPQGSSRETHDQRGTKTGSNGKANKHWRPKADEVYRHILKSYQGRIMTKWQLEDCIKMFPNFFALIHRFEASMFNIFKVNGKVRYIDATSEGGWGMGCVCK